MPNSQSAYAVRFDWGLAGVREVANRSGAAVLVDVLSFSTCVEIATARGATILPCRERDAAAADLAARAHAALAGPRSEPGLSLSPRSLTAIGAGTLLVLPPPN